jgi:hypothetical protein
MDCVDNFKYCKIFNEYVMFCKLYSSKFVIQKVIRLFVKGSSMNEVTYLIYFVPPSLIVNPFFT